jgi:hypothetical protein
MILNVNVFTIFINNVRVHAKALYNNTYKRGAVSWHLHAPIAYLHLGSSVFLVLCKRLNQTVSENVLTKYGDEVRP